MGTLPLPYYHREVQGWPHIGNLFPCLTSTGRSRVGYIPGTIPLPYLHRKVQAQGWSHRGTLPLPYFHRRVDLILGNPSPSLLPQGCPGLTTYWGTLSLPYFHRKVQGWPHTGEPFPFLTSTGRSRVDHISGKLFPSLLPQGGPGLTTYRGTLSLSFFHRNVQGWPHTGNPYPSLLLQGGPGLTTYRGTLTIPYFHREVQGWPHTRKPFHFLIPGNPYHSLPPQGGPGLTTYRGTLPLPYFYRKFLGWQRTGNLSQSLFFQLGCPGFNTSKEPVFICSTEFEFLVCPF